MSARLGNRESLAWFWLCETPPGLSEESLASQQVAVDAPNSSVERLGEVSFLSTTVAVAVSLLGPHSVAIP